MAETLRQLRYNRTRASNIVRASIAHCLTGKATYFRPDGLPSWWPFWSDALKNNVRDAVRAARALVDAEAAPRVYDGTEGQDRSSYSDTQDRQNYSVDE